MSGKIDTPAVSVKTRIHIIRGQLAMLDYDVASLHSVPVAQVRRAIRRYPSRFPADFAFRLCHDEWAQLECQVDATCQRPDTNRTPWALTDHGVAMLASVLRKQFVPATTIEVLRTFAFLRSSLEAAALRSHAYASV